MGLHLQLESTKLKGWSANIRLGRKWMTVTNTEAYSGTELITAVKMFI